MKLETLDLNRRTILAKAVVIRNAFCLDTCRARQGYFIQEVPHLVEHLCSYYRQQASKGEGLDGRANSQGESPWQAH